MRRPVAALLAVLGAAALGPPAAAQVPLPPPPVELPAESAVLGMTQDSGFVDLVGPEGGPVRLDGRPQSATGALPLVAVTDDRAAAGPWSLTATITDFVVDGVAASCGGAGDYRCIPGGNLGWTPAAQVATLELDPPAVTTGPPIAAGAASNLRTGPQLLCAAPAPPPADPEAPAPPAPPPVIVCSAGLSLLVPASTAAGTYLATLTLTLV